MSNYLNNLKKRIFYCLVLCFWPLCFLLLLMCLVISPLVWIISGKDFSRWTFSIYGKYIEFLGTPFF